MAARARGGGSFLGLFLIESRSELAKLAFGPGADDFALELCGCFLISVQVEGASDFLKPSWVLHLPRLDRLNIFLASVYVVLRVLPDFEELAGNWIHHLRFGVCVREVVWRLFRVAFGKLKGLALFVLQQLVWVRQLFLMNFLELLGVFAAVP